MHSVIMALKEGEEVEMCTQIEIHKPTDSYQQSSHKAGP